MVEMIAVVMDTSYKKLGELAYISFIWTERYYEAGDFELILPITTDNVAMCQMGNYIIRGDIAPSTVYGDGVPYDCYENMGVIEAVEYDTDAFDSERMVVSGRFITGVLSRRVTAEWHGENIRPQTVAYRLISENMGVQASAERRVPELQYASFNVDETGITDTIDVVFNGENLLDACSALAESNGFGYRLRCMPLYKPLYMDEGSYWDLYTYVGTDRSYGQSTNPFVVFSDDYDNLESAYYREDARELITDVMVNGEVLEDGTRYVTWATNGNVNTGLNRYESFIESSQMRTLDDGTVLTDAQYIKNLQQEGRLSIRNLEQAFSGEVYFGQYVWRRDVNMGDIVTIKNNRWGIYVNARIIEMIESTSEAGQYISLPTFGK